MIARYGDLSEAIPRGRAFAGGARGGVGAAAQRPKSSALGRRGLRDRVLSRMVAIPSHPPLRDRQSSRGRQHPRPDPSPWAGAFAGWGALARRAKGLAFGSGALASQGVGRRQPANAPPAPQHHRARLTLYAGAPDCNTRTRARASALQSAQQTRPPPPTRPRRHTNPPNTKPDNPPTLCFQ